MKHSTSAPNERVLRTTQLAKLSFNHPSVVLTADVFQYLYKIPHVYLQEGTYCYARNTAVPADTKCSMHPQLATPRLVLTADSSRSSRKQQQLSCNGGVADGGGGAACCCSCLFLLPLPPPARHCRRCCSFSVVFFLPFGLYGFETAAALAISKLDKAPAADQHYLRRRRRWRTWLDLLLLCLHRLPPPNAAAAAISRVVNQPTNNVQNYYLIETASGNTLPYHSDSTLTNKTVISSQISTSYLPVSSLSHC